MSTVLMFWMSGWSSSILTSFVDMLKAYWSEGTTPTIDDVMDYRSLDLANKEYVLLEVLEETDRFLGLGAMNYQKSVMISIILKTGVSDTRAREMLEESRRIFRTKSYWIGDFQNLKINRNVNMGNRERKIWSYKFTVTAIKMETIDEEIEIVREDIAIIVAGDTEVTVTHSKGILNYPVISPLQDIGGRRCWVEYIDVNSFEIHIDSADPFSNFSFNYRC